MVPENMDNINSHSIKSNNSYFFDNNIWMFLFCPIGNTNAKKQQILSNFLSDLLSRNCSIIVNSLILSEFSNASLRLDFDIYKQEVNILSSFKKDYFKTERCKNTRAAISSAIKQIEKVSDKYNDQYNSIDLDLVLNYYNNFLDFNDCYFMHICEKNNWFFVTDDKDFDIFNSTQINIIKP